MALFAIPVIHAAGGWIASAGGSYLAGTKAATWLGSFALANKGILAGVGAGFGLTGAAATTAAVKCSQTAAEVIPNLPPVL